MIWCFGPAIADGCTIVHLSLNLRQPPAPGDLALPQAVLETGAEPYCGCFYSLPHYHIALDVRQGVAIFHR